MNDVCHRMTLCHKFIVDHMLCTKISFLDAVARLPAFARDNGDKFSSSMSEAYLIRALTHYSIFKCVSCHNWKIMSDEAEPHSAECSECVESRANWKPRCKHIWATKESHVDMTVEECRICKEQRTQDH